MNASTDLSIAATTSSEHSVAGHHQQTQGSHMSAKRLNELAVKHHRSCHLLLIAGILVLFSSIELPLTARVVQSVPQNGRNPTRPLSGLI